MKSTILLLILLLSSCTSLRKSMVYGGLAGGAIGAYAGSALSPDSYSKAPNALVWGGVGLLSGAALGYFFFNDDPENRDLPQMILKDQNKIREAEEFSAPMIVPTEASKYKIKNGPLPDSLRSKIPHPSIIEMTIPERIQHLDNGRTIVIDAHKATEVIYE
jgi:hypothetical protein